MPTTGIDSPSVCGHVEPVLRLRVPDRRRLAEHQVARLAIPHVESWEGRGTGRLFMHFLSVFRTQHTKEMRLT